MYFSKFLRQVVYEGDPVAAGQQVDFEQTDADRSRYTIGHNIHPASEIEDEAGAGTTPYDGAQVPSDPTAAAPPGAPPADSELQPIEPGGAPAAPPVQESIMKDDIDLYLDALLDESVERINEGPFDFQEPQSGYAQPNAGFSGRQQAPASIAAGGPQAIQNWQAQMAAVHSGGNGGSSPPRRSSSTADLNRQSAASHGGYMAPQSYSGSGGYNANNGGGNGGRGSNFTNASGGSGGGRNRPTNRVPGSAPPPSEEMDVPTGGRSGWQQPKGNAQTYEPKFTPAATPGASEEMDVPTTGSGPGSVSAPSPLANQYQPPFKAGEASPKTSVLNPNPAGSGVAAADKVTTPTASNNPTSSNTSWFNPFPSSSSSTASSSPAKPDALRSQMSAMAGEPGMGNAPASQTTAPAGGAAMRGGTGLQQQQPPKPTMTDAGGPAPVPPPSQQRLPVGIPVADSNGQNSMTHAGTNVDTQPAAQQPSPQPSPQAAAKAPEETTPITPMMLSKGWGMNWDDYNILHESDRAKDKKVRGY